MKKGYREQDSPIDYFPDDKSKKATRVTFIDGPTDVGFLDLYLTDDTMYILYMEVKPEYRGQKFLQYMRPEKEETRQKFSRDKIVWLNINPAIAENTAKFLDFRRKLVEEDGLPSSTIYMNGAKFGIEET